MKKTLVLATVVSLAALTVQAQLPQRDLTVELRQTDEGGAGYVVGTQPRVPLLAPQQVQVRNGARASLSCGQAMPMQWVQSAAAHSASLAASGVSAGSRGGAVTQALTWLEAGQKLTVKPSWPGGKRAATVEVEVQSARVEARTGAELPAQKRSQVATTVSAPLGQWVTIAITGSSPQPGVYSSEAANEPRRLLQLRVTAP
jgi:hypothetical protein